MRDHVNILPNELLLGIFDRIPLLELLHLDQVCHRWAELLSTAAARRTGTLALILDGNEQNLAQILLFNIPLNCTLDMSAEEASKIRLSSRTTLKCLLSDQDTLFCGGESTITEMARFRRAHFTGQLRAYFGKLFPKADKRKLVVIRTKRPSDDNGLDFLVEGLRNYQHLKIWTPDYFWTQITCYGSYIEKKREQYSTKLTIVSMVNPSTEDEIEHVQLAPIENGDDQSEGGEGGGGLKKKSKIMKKKIKKNMKLKGKAAEFYHFY